MGHVDRELVAEPQDAFYASALSTSSHPGTVVLLQCAEGIISVPKEALKITTHK